MGHGRDRGVGVGLGAQLAAPLLGVFVVAAVATVFLVNHHMRRQALVEAEAAAVLVLEQNLATHAYFAHQLKPSVFALTDAVRSSAYFNPIWMSSTYAIREINKGLPSFGAKGYYYKECAVNARDPGNEADPFERAFLEELRGNPDLTVRSGIRTLDGEPFFYTLRRGESMEAPCLRCHSEPAAAPEGLVELYGPERSFHRTEGELVSAVSIRVPLAAAFAQANRFSAQLSVGLLAVMACLFLLLLAVHRRFVVRPLSVVRHTALGIAASEAALGETIEARGGRELRDLAAAFNTLSLRLREHVDGLEERVRDRTAELESANANLRQEVAERQRAEREKEAVILELREAVAQVRTLSGLIPICAWCKKIRDDQGYWTQLESYLRKHSGTEFSHGICPECAAKV